MVIKFSLEVQVMKIIFFVIFFFVLSPGLISDTFTVGFDHKYPPYEFVNQRGEADGFNIELIGLIFDQLDLDYELKGDRWSNIISLVDEGRIDLLSGLFFSPERLQKYDFSRPHSSVKANLFFRYEDNKRFRSFSDFADAEIIVQEGDVLHELVLQLRISDNIMVVDSPERALRLVASGRYDAAFINHYQGLHFSRLYSLSNIAHLPIPVYEFEYCFAVPKNNLELIRMVDRELEELIESGVYDEVYQKWFGDYFVISRQIDLKFYYAVLGTMAFVIIIFLTYLTIRYHRKMQKKSAELKKEFAEHHITSHKLELYEKKQTQFFHDFPFIIFETDKNGKITYLNRAGHEIFGVYDFQDGILYLKDLLDNRSYDSFSKTLLKIIDKKENLSEELMFKNREGKLFPGLLYVKPIIDENEVLLLSGMIVDLSEFKQNLSEINNLNNQLKNKSQELEQIIYVTTHDLRSPLTNIAGFIKEIESVLKETRSIILENYCLDNVLSPVENKKINDYYNRELPENMNFIETSINKMNTLINSLLNYHRLGSSAIDMQTINMDSLLREVLKVFEFILKKNDIDLHLSRLPDCFSDYNLISQVFSNVIENAIKYKRENTKGIIKIYGYAQSSYSVYCIEDNGIGIKNEDQTKVFQLFKRGSSKNVGGTGIGLAVAAKIVSRLNGEIWFTSKKEEGTVFHIKLPCKMEEKNSD